MIRKIAMVWCVAGAVMFIYALVTIKAYRRGLARSFEPIWAWMAESYGAVIGFHISEGQFLALMIVLVIALVIGFRLGAR